MDGMVAAALLVSSLSLLASLSALAAAARAETRAKNACDQLARRFNGGYYRTAAVGRPTKRVPK